MHCMSTLNHMTCCIRDRKTHPGPKLACIGNRTSWIHTGSTQYTRVMQGSNNPLWVIRSTRW